MILSVKQLTADVSVTTCWPSLALVVQQKW